MIYSPVAVGPSGRFYVLANVGAFWGDESTRAVIQVGNVDHYEVFDSPDERTTWLIQLAALVAGDNR